jgi:hypothetical protein
MELDSEKKLKVFKDVFRILGRYYRLADMTAHVREAKQGGTMCTLDPDEYNP